MVTFSKRTNVCQDTRCCGFFLSYDMTFPFCLSTEDNIYLLWTENAHSFERLNLFFQEHLSLFNGNQISWENEVNFSVPNMRNQIPNLAEFLMEAVNLNLFKAVGTRKVYCISQFFRKTFSRVLNPWNCRGRENNPPVN